MATLQPACEEELREVVPHPLGDRPRSHGEGYCQTGIDGNEKEVIKTSRGLLHHNKQEFDGNICIQKGWHCEEV
jgi:hypothetical protein